MNRDLASAIVCFIVGGISLSINKGLSFLVGTFLIGLGFMFFMVYKSIIVRSKVYTYFYAVGTIEGLGLGIGVPVITYFGVTGIFGAVVNTDVPPVAFSLVSDITLNLLYLCFESIIFCTIGGFCLAKLIGMRKKKLPLSVSYYPVEKM